MRLDRVVHQLAAPAYKRFIEKPKSGPPPSVGFFRAFSALFPIPPRHCSSCAFALRHFVDAGPATGENATQCDLVNQ